jgi:Integrase core domain/Chromo (CHRromatin Organisation MOdifier) domain
MNEDMQLFLRNCIHCHSTSGPYRIPRPLMQTLHATLPNQLLHFDFLYIGPSISACTYVLILKNDHTNYAWLGACKDADGDSAVQAILEWCSAFGIVHDWCSDQGRHFVNLLMQSVARELRVKHRFTTAYAPWANGPLPVEVVRRSGLSALRKLCSEFSWAFTQWPTVLHIVQSLLNSTPSTKLGGRSPLTVFTMLPAENPVLICLPKGPVEAASLETLRAEQCLNVTELQTVVGNMHKEVAATADHLREKAVRVHNQRTNMQLINFDIGDYVLVGTVQRQKLPKLVVLWQGPYRAVRFENEQVLEVEHLLSGKRKTVHCTRIKFYHDASLGVTEELKSHLQYQDSTLFVIEQLLEFREVRGQVQVLVKWMGFDEGENTWEPVTTILEDAPDLLRIP